MQSRVMKIKEISTTYAIENLASGHVLQKLGFQFIKGRYECNGGDIVTTGDFADIRRDRFLIIRGNRKYGICTYSIDGLQNR